MRNTRGRNPESVIIALCAAAAVALILGSIAMNSQCAETPEDELARVSRERDRALRSLYGRYRPTTISAAIRDRTTAALGRCESGISRPMCDLLRETAAHGVEEVDRRILGWMLREHAEGGKIPLLTDEMEAFFADEQIARAIGTYARLDRQAEELRATLYPDATPEWGWKDVLPFVVMLLRSDG